MISAQRQIHQILTLAKGHWHGVMSLNPDWVSVTPSLRNNLYNCIVQAKYYYTLTIYTLLTLDLELHYNLGSLLLLALASMPSLAAFRDA